MTELLLLDIPPMRDAASRISRLNERFSVVWIKDLAELSKRMQSGAAIAISSPAAFSELREWILGERYLGGSQLAKGVGHELGNILLRIVGKTDLALMETDLAKAQAHIQGLMAASDRATLIVRNLQAFARGQVQLQKGSLKEVLDLSVETLAADVARYKCKVEKNYEKVSLVQVDPGALMQAFANITLNALQSMSAAPGSLTLSISSDLENGVKGVAVRFRDTGTGIAPELLPEVFEFGFTTRGARGAGIGLSVARDILSSHGAVIRIETVVGKGTEVRVWFPVEGSV